MPKIDDWNLQLSNRIVKVVKSNGFLSAIAKGERGYGKSMYNLKTMAKVYYEVDGLSETDAWNKALDSFIFTPNQLLDRIDYNINNEIISPVWCIDDATVHFSSYLYFINLYQASLVNAAFDTIRTVVSAMLLNCPNKKRLLGGLRFYDDYDISIYKDRGYVRRAVGIKWYSLPDGKRRFRKEFEDVFSCYVPDWVYEEYRPMRRKYLEDVTDKLEELSLKHESKKQP